MTDRELLELIATQVGGLTSQVSTLTSKVENIEKSQQETNQRTAQLENKIENQIGDKVRALFDAHTLYLDYFESLKDGQARIEQTVSSISRQQINYEYKLSDYDRELRLIRSEKKK